MSYFELYEQVVGAVVVSADPASASNFCGTAFLVAPGVIMTARHVLDDALNKPKDAGRPAVVFGTEDAEGWLKLSTYYLADLHLDTNYDIAVARVIGLTREDHLELDDRNRFPPNRTVTTVEYSGVRTFADIGEPGSGETGMNVLSTTRLGHITRRPYLSTLGLRKPTQCLSLSFPALKGASGAPVWWEDSHDGAVCGMIVGNLEEELLPVHVERVTNSEGELSESRKYMLPTAVAISATHLIAIRDQFLSNSSNT